MPSLSPEWTFWSLTNGLPAIVAAILFVVYPAWGYAFAWDIRHRQTLLFFSAGFLARAGMFAWIIASTAWPDIRWIVGGNTVFAAVLLGVTMVYGEQFVWRRLIAIIWTFLYIEEPIWMLSLVAGAQAATTGLAPAGTPINPLLQGVLWVEAAVMLVAGIYLFFAHRVENPAWPWKPDRLSAFIMAGFPLSWAVWAPTLAMAGGWAQARGGVLVNLLFLGALLVLALVFRSQFDLSRRPVQVYIGVLAALLLLLGAGFAVQV